MPDGASKISGRISWGEGYDTVALSAWNTKNPRIFGSGIKNSEMLESFKKTYKEHLSL
jgi:hypothetical protein